MSMTQEWIVTFESGHLNVTASVEATDIIGAIEAAKPIFDNTGVIGDIVSAKLKENADVTLEQCEICGLVGDETEIAWTAIGYRCRNCHEG